MMSLRSSPMSDLTDDLVEEILARVPVTSLKRLRSICKNWNTLFNDQRFTKKHFDKAKKEYLNLMFRSDRLSWMSVNLHGLHDNTDLLAIEFKGEFSLKDFFEVGNFKVFHCNGFFLCTNRSTTMVWNPCTGQIKRILTKSANTLYNRYALGYVQNKSGHDYKILRFLSHKPSELEIFEFDSDSWRVSGGVNPDFKYVGGGVSVKGDTYWIAYDDNDYYSCSVISFDFTTERFGPRVCLSFQGHFDLYVMSLYSVREERLSVLLQNKDASKTEIWMTNDMIETNVMSWSIFLKIDFNFNRPLWHGTSFFIDEKNKFAVVFHTVNYFLYTFGEDSCRIVNLRDEPGCVFVPQLFSYVSSLVLI